MMDHQRSKAIDLMVEDLHRVHDEIRTKAKWQGCESELDDVKRQVLDYLNFLRKSGAVINSGTEAYTETLQ